MNIIYSANQIERQFRTGEEPVMVMGSDLNTYICKYMRSSSNAYKLACELIGAKLAMTWQINTPEIALIFIKQQHWEGIKLPHSLSAPSIGFKKLDSVVDITPSTFASVPTNIDILYQLLKIAFFDFWIANEDRNANNANLMYNMSQEQLVSIDYGCIFNTATFDYPLSQLTSTDTILCSDFFKHLSGDIDRQEIFSLANRLIADYKNCLDKSKLSFNFILNDMPKEWNVSMDSIDVKLQQLLDTSWTEAVIDNFMDCLKENIE